MSEFVKATLWRNIAAEFGKKKSSMKKKAKAQRPSQSYLHWLRNLEVIVHYTQISIHIIQYFHTFTK